MDMDTDIMSYLDAFGKVYEQRGETMNQAPFVVKGPKEQMNE